MVKWNDVKKKSNELLAKADVAYKVTFVIGEEINQVEERTVFSRSTITLPKYIPKEDEELDVIKVDGYASATGYPNEYRIYGNATFTWKWKPITPHYQFEYKLVLVELFKNIFGHGDSAFYEKSEFMDSYIDEYYDGKYERKIEPRMSILKYTGGGNLVRIPTYLDEAKICKIGEKAFYKSKIKTVYIPKYCTFIEAYAFKDCQALEEVVILGKVEGIAMGAFSGCTKLSKINLPKELTHIGEKAFENCVSLDSIHIPEAVSWIGDSAFEGCKNLKKINFPKSLIFIGKKTFENCISLDSNYILKNVSSIEDPATYCRNRILDAYCSSYARRVKRKEPDES